MENLSPTEQAQLRRALGERRVFHADNAIDAAALQAAIDLQAAQPRADYTIVELPVLGNPVSTDVVPIYHNGLTYGVTAGLLAGVSTTSQSIVVFNVKNYGAVGNGVNDDTSAIQAAITALAAAGGGTLYFPLGTYIISSTINIGNGTGSPNQSTYQSIKIVGGGSGAGQTSNTQQITRLRWTGAYGGTMLAFNGTLYGVYMQGILVDGNSGLAGYGIIEADVAASTFRDVWVTNCITINWWRLGSGNGGTIGPAYVNYFGCGITCSPTLNGVSAAAPMIGLCLGGTTGQPYTYNGPNDTTLKGAYEGHYYDFAILMYGSNNAVALDLRSVDHNYFDGGFIVGQYSVRCSPNPNVVNFPQGNRFLRSDWQGNANTPGGTSGGHVTTNGTFVLSSVADLNYVEFLDNGQTYPGSATVNPAYWPVFPWLCGKTGIGAQFGPYGYPSRSPLSWVNRAGDTKSTFTTLAQLNVASFPIVAGRLNGAAATFRVKAGGSYSTTGTPTYQLQIRLGTVVLLDTGAITCSGVTQRFELEFEGTVGTAGASGTINTQLANAAFQSNATGAKFIAGSPGGVLDLTAAQSVSIWVACSAASASNTITLYAWSVDIVYPPLDAIA